MIYLDIPLAATALFFFAISWLYGWGLLRFFRYNFRWSYASVIGILSVISCLASFVWFLRYDKSIVQEIYWSLFVVFSAALPGMLWTDIELRKDRAARIKRVEELEQRILEQDEMMRSIETLIREQGKKSLNEIIQVLEMRDQAKELLKEHIENLN